MAANERAHWLAVYALGLTAAGNLKNAVTDLTTQADYDAEVLDVARAHLGTGLHRRLRHPGTSDRPAVSSHRPRPPEATAGVKARRRGQISPPRCGRLSDARAPTTPTGSRISFTAPGTVVGGSR
jgi:hypothetical protein